MRYLAIAAALLAFQAWSAVNAGSKSAQSMLQEERKFHLDELATIWQNIKIQCDSKFGRDNEDYFRQRKEFDNTRRVIDDSLGELGIEEPYSTGDLERVFVGILSGIEDDLALARSQGDNNSASFFEEARQLMMCGQQSLSADPLQYLEPIRVTDEVFQYDGL